MGLDHRQKKFIKKNIRAKSIALLAQEMAVPAERIHEYLQNTWGKEKYRNFLSITSDNNQDMQKAGGRPPAFIWLRNNWYYVAGLVVLTFAAYANALPSAFVSDDTRAILNNPDVGRLSVALQNGIFSIRELIYFVIYKLFALQPWPYRLANLLFHAGTVLALFGILRQMTGKAVAFAAAAAYAVHPILIESVTWISGGSYSQYTFFIFSSLFFYILSKQSRKYYFFSLAIYSVGVLFSEKAVVYPAVLFVYELAYGNVYRNWKKILPFCLPAAFMGITMVSHLGPRIESFQNDYYQSEAQWYNPLQQIPTAISSYLQLILIPVGYTLYHTELAFTPLEFALRVAVTMAYFSLTAFSFFKNRFIFFWLALFVIALSPTLTPIPVAWIVAERYAYFAASGIVVAAVYGIYIIFRKFREQTLIFASVAAVIIAGLFVRTIVRNIDWFNEDNLYISAGKTSPSSENNHNNLGDVYTRQGDYARAEAEFKRAIELKPNYADAYHNMANTLKIEGKLDEALAYYKTALKINPRIWQSYHGISEIYFTRKDFIASLEWMGKALEVSPANPQILNNIAVIYLQMNNKAEALKYVQKALAVNPQYPQAVALYNQLHGGSGLNFDSR